MADKRTKKAMTLVEVLIVVAILGILAAATLPYFKTHTAKANEASAKDNLRVLRNCIGVYAAQHGGLVPGYINGSVNLAPLLTQVQLINSTKYNWRVFRFLVFEYYLLFDILLTSIKI